MKEVEILDLLEANGIKILKPIHINLPLNKKIIPNTNENSNLNPSPKKKSPFNFFKGKKKDNNNNNI